MHLIYIINNELKLNMLNRVKIHHIRQWDLTQRKLMITSIIKSSNLHK